MSQTNTNNNGVSNTNRNQNVARGRHGHQGGSGGRGRSGHSSNRGNSSIAKYSCEGKMKDGCLSNLTITESTHQATQYNKSDDDGLSHKPYNKMVVAVKSLHNFSNSKPSNPHTFKEELKIKYNVMLAIVRKFPNRTGVMEQFIKVEISSLTWANYCTMTPANQLIWEEKLDAQNKTVLLLMNPKNHNAKKDLRLIYAQGNHSAYPETVESMARFLSLQYNIKTVNNPCNK